VSLIGEYALQEVLPMLKNYVRNRSKAAKAVDVNFFVPKYIYGDYDADR
jgi:hypothetical protein